MAIEDVEVIDDNQNQIDDEANVKQIQTPTKEETEAPAQGSQRRRVKFQREDWRDKESVPTSSRGFKTKEMDDEQRRQHSAEQKHRLLRRTIG